MKNILNKSCSLLLLFFLIGINTNAQNIAISSGITVSLSSTNLALSGNWNNHGTLNAGTGTFIFSGASGNQTIINPSGEPFYNLIVDKVSGNVQLIDSITVNGTLTLTSGDIDLNGAVITLGGSALLSETAGNTVKGTSGYITTTRTLNAPSSDNVAGMGAEITTSANLGSTVIIRGHTAQTSHSNNGITRYFDLTPVNDTGLNATLVFHYDNSELNSITATDLELFRTTDNGISWTAEGGTVNTTNNTVTLSDINSLSRWTLAGSSSPLLVELSSLSASSNKGSVTLIGNYPNPFNPTTDIEFYTPIKENVTIKIFDMLGREVRTLLNQQIGAGYHVVYWNGKDRYGQQAASGVYLYRLTAGSYNQTKKMVMMK